MLKFYSLPLTILIFFLIIPNISAEKITTSKMGLLVYEGARTTFFCHQPFNEKGQTVTKACAYCPEKITNIIWMPIVPKATFAKNRPCWFAKLCVDKHGKAFSGARCCQKTDLLYQTMSKDLHNLVPELSITAQQRRTYPFGETDILPNLSANCHFIIDKKNHTLSPAPELRGFIARVYLYMAKEYHLSLPENQHDLYTRWHQTYPASAWEIERNKRIYQLQGKSNHFTT